MIYWCGIFLLSKALVISVFFLINHLVIPPQNERQNHTKIHLTVPSHEKQKETHPSGMQAFEPPPSAFSSASEVMAHALLSESSLPDASDLMALEFATLQMQEISQAIQVNMPFFQAITPKAQPISETSNQISDTVSHIIETPNNRIEKNTTQALTPTYRVEPEYPSRALRRNIEGEVVLGFVINAQGRPENIRVISANPSRIFDRAAINAVRQWKYSEINIEQTIQLVFEIEK